MLHDKGEEIATAMQDIQGVKDIKVEQIAGQPYLTIDIDRQKISRHGINVADVQELIVTAIGGKPATYVYEGERRFQLVLRFRSRPGTALRPSGDPRESGIRRRDSDARSGQD